MPITVSNSSAKKFLRCKRQYFYAVVQGLELRLQDPKLKAGNWFHQLMAAKYQGEDWTKIHKRLTRQFQNLTLEEREHYGDLPDMVYRMMISYLWNYQKMEEEWEILWAEESFEVEFQMGDKFSFKPDLIIRDHSKIGQGKVWIVDHKTVRSIPTAEFRLHDLQSTLYPWALGEVFPDLEIEGFIFNYIRRKAPSVPKINKDGSISRARIDTDYPTFARFAMDYYEVDNVNALPSTVKTRLRTLKEEHKFLKRTRIKKPGALVERQFIEFSYNVQELEVWLEMEENNPNEDVWIRNMIPSCEWDCEFYDLCLIELLGQDSTFMKKRKYKPSTYTKERGLGQR